MFASLTPGRGRVDVGCKRRWDLQHRHGECRMYSSDLSGTATAVPAPLMNRVAILCVVRWTRVGLRVPRGTWSPRRARDSTQLMYVPVGGDPEGSTAG